jgi:hypothetical protein
MSVLKKGRKEAIHQPTYFLFSLPKGVFMFFWLVYIFSNPPGLDYNTILDMGIFSL